MRAEDGTARNLARHGCGTKLWHGRSRHGRHGTEGKASSFCLARKGTAEGLLETEKAARHEIWRGTAVARAARFGGGAGTARHGQSGAARTGDRRPIWHGFGDGDSSGDGSRTASGSRWRREESRKTEAGGRLGLHGRNLSRQRAMLGLVRSAGEDNSKVTGGGILPDLGRWRVTGELWLGRELVVTEWELGILVEGSEQRTFGLLVVEAEAALGLEQRQIGNLVGRGW